MCISRHSLSNSKQSWIHDQENRIDKVEVAIIVVLRWVCGDPKTSVIRVG